MAYSTIAAWLMIMLSLGVMFAAFPGRYNVVYAPGFIGNYGLLFGLLYAAAQYAVAVFLKSRRAVVLISGLFLVGAGLGAIGRALDIHGFYAEHNVSYTSYVFASGACASGLAFGIAIVRGWVAEKK